MMPILFFKNTLPFIPFSLFIALLICAMILYFLLNKQMPTTLLTHRKVLQTGKQKLELSTKDSSSNKKKFLCFAISKHRLDLDACRNVESLQHVARHEQRRNDVERDGHLVESSSQHLDEGVADETQCHTFCDVVG